ncbi:MAG: ribonuclease PH [Anaerolineales bacterium]|jgi:ribonuclease PH|nr:ribonuclease PH [Anaerolineales bacterium]
MTTISRHAGRAADELRSISITPGYIDYPEGSVLLELGDTRVLCNVTIEKGVPKWMEARDPQGGWITAEYAMLPRATHQRTAREVGKPRARSQEIRRMIGRSLRAGFNLEALPPITCIVDCDVLQADGGTRTAAVTGGYVALAMALNTLIAGDDPVGDIYQSPVAAISVGLLEGIPIVDLDYAEDSIAEADINIVMNEQGELIEIQGTAERKPFSADTLTQMLHLANSSIGQLIRIQRLALEEQGLFL